MDSPVKAQKVRTAVAPPVAPDGGYAWFIMLSCFLVFGLTFGVIKAFGVFYVEIHEYFGTTATETSWITSIAVATIHVVGNYLFFLFKNFVLEISVHVFFNIFPKFYICIVTNLSTLFDLEVKQRLVEVVTTRWLSPTSKMMFNFTCQVLFCVKLILITHEI